MAADWASVTPDSAPPFGKVQRPRRVRTNKNSTPVLRIRKHTAATSWRGSGMSGYFLVLRIRASRPALGCSNTAQNNRAQFGSNLLGCTRLRTLRIVLARAMYLSTYLRAFNLQQSIFNNQKGSAVWKPNIVSAAIENLSPAASQSRYTCSRRQLACGRGRNLRRSAFLFVRNAPSLLPWDRHLRVR